MNFELTQEQVMFRDMARKFARQEILPMLKEYERRHEINFGLIKKTAELGLRGVQIPQEYGGLGLDYSTAAVIWEQLGWASWSQTLMSVGHGVLGGSVTFNVASQEQKQKYLPPLCRGELIIAVAAVESNAGSDAAAIETTAVLDGDQWVINGTKLFISHGSVADVVFVLAQTDKSLGSRGLAIIAVDKGTPGFSSSGMEMVGDWAGDVASLRFTDCRVPKEKLSGR